MTDTQTMVYIGQSGAGLGFQLSGVAVTACDDVTALLPLLRQYKNEGAYKIIFVDEGLAQPVLGEIEKMSEAALPVIMLLPRPGAALHVTQAKMNDLVIKAVGSDILN